MSWRGGVFSYLHILYFQYKAQPCPQKNMQRDNLHVSPKENRYENKLPYKRNVPSTLYRAHPKTLPRLIP